MTDPTIQSPQCTPSKFESNSWMARGRGADASGASSCCCSSSRRLARVPCLHSCSTCECTRPLGRLLFPFLFFVLFCCFFYSATKPRFDHVFGHVHLPTGVRVSVRARGPGVARASVPVFVRVLPLVLCRFAVRRGGPRKNMLYESPRRSPG